MNECCTDTTTFAAHVTVGDLETEVVFTSDNKVLIASTCTFQFMCKDIVVKTRFKRFQMTK